MSSNPLALLDEILQVMYWLRGEDLAASVSAEDLSRWVMLDALEIEPYLERLVEKGYLEAAGPDGRGRYRLTPVGVREGGRRFEDEFSDLTRQGHGQCSEADCDCQATGDPADCKNQVA